LVEDEVWVAGWLGVGLCGGMVTSH
jgi:hypothetical protein